MVPVPTVKTLPSGAKLEIKSLPFKERHDLFKAMARSILGIKIDLQLSKADFENLEKLADGDAPVNDLKNLVCQIIADESLETHVERVLGRCLLNGVAINCPGSFEESPEDYYPAASEVARFAVAPFFKGLVSAFSSVQNRNSSSPK